MGISEGTASGRKRNSPRAGERAVRKSREPVQFKWRRGLVKKRCTVVDENSMGRGCCSGECDVR